LDSCLARDAERSKPAPTLLHLKANLGWLLFLIFLLQKLVKLRMGCHKMINNDYLLAFENKKLMTILQDGY
jgi:hypothetical protein